MLCLLNDGSECKDVINGLMCRMEPCFPPSSKESSLKLPRELHMKDNNIELGEGVAHHDGSIVIWIGIRARFMYRVNSVVRPSLWKTIIDDMLKQVDQVVI
jgi:hypothetical protein